MLCDDRVVNLYIHARAVIPASSMIFAAISDGSGSLEVELDDESSSSMSSSEEEDDCSCCSRCCRYAAFIIGSV